METKKLTKDYLLEIFDYKDGNFYWKLKSHRSLIQGKEAGNFRTDGYRAIGINKKIYKAHRLIFMMFNGYMPLEIDHINGDKGDNRIENLREVTHNQNSLNRKLRIDNVSKCKGVRWVQANKAYMVRVTIKGKRKFLGYFKDFDLADLVATEARDLHHGKYANYG
jgi:hypothetical protein